MIFEKPERDRPNSLDDCLPVEIDELTDARFQVIAYTNYIFKYGIPEVKIENRKVPISRADLTCKLSNIRGDVRDAVRDLLHDLYAIFDDVQGGIIKRSSPRDIWNDDNDPQRLDDWYLGVRTEYGVAKGLTGGAPDLSVYLAGDSKVASYESDLNSLTRPLLPEYVDLHLAVKACAAGAVGSPTDSWTVGLKDPIYCNPLPHHLIILTYGHHRRQAVVKRSSAVYILGMAAAVDVQDCWETCQIEKMKHKRAIYRSRVSDKIVYVGPGLVGI